MSAHRHTVGTNECFSSIAFENGFFWSTLWNLDTNEALRKKRASPFVLEQGDVVDVPDIRIKQVPAATGQRHVFRRRGVPAPIQVVLQMCGQPAKGLPYTLIVDGVPRSGVTADDGRIEGWVPPNVASVKLVLGEGESAVVHELLARVLEPVTHERGVRARLRNLGYAGSPNDEAASDAAALARFQQDHGLEPTGEADDATRAKLVELHGS